MPKSNNSQKAKSTKNISTHSCLKGLKTRRELCKNSLFYGIQKTLDYDEYDYELRQCKVCGSIFVAANVPKKNIPKKSLNASQQKKKDSKR